MTKKKKQSLEISYGLALNLFLIGMITGVLSGYVIGIIGSGTIITKTPQGLFNKQLTDSYCKSQGYDWGMIDTLTCKDESKPVKCFDSRYDGSIKIDCLSYIDYYLWSKEG